MGFTFQFIIRLFLTMLLSAILTPLIKLLAFKIGAVDAPGERRINQKTMPTAGGLAIFLSFSLHTFGLFMQKLPIFAAEFY